MCDAAQLLMALMKIELLEKEMKKDQYYRSRDELIEMRW